MEVIWTYIGFLRKKLRQIGADIELKNHPVAAFHHACRRGRESSSGVCAGRVVLGARHRAVSAQLSRTEAVHHERQPRTQNPADRHLHERGRVGDGKRRKRMGAEHPIAIRAAVKAHFQPCHALPSGRGKPVPGAHGVFPQRCGVGDRGAVFVSGRGKGKEYTQYIEDGITITGDRTAIGQLVSILLDNAIKYSADCGVIRLHVCRSGKRAEIEVYFTLVLCSGTPFSSITVDKFQGINNILLFQLWYSHAAPPRKCVHTLCHKERSVFNMPQGAVCFQYHT